MNVNYVKDVEGKRRGLFCGDTVPKIAWCDLEKLSFNMAAGTAKRPKYDAQSVSTCIQSASHVEYICRIRVDDNSILLINLNIYMYKSNIRIINSSEPICLNLSLVAVCNICRLNIEGQADDSA